MATLSDILSRGVESYTGKPVERVQVHPDPEVRGTYAVRASVRRVYGVETLDFLIVGGNVDGGLLNADAETVADHLEETEFRSWPPRSGAVRFF